MIDWFLNLVPWWAWAIAAVIALAAVHSLLGGWRNTIAAAGVALGAILALMGYQKGRTAERAATEARVAAKEREDVQTVSDVRADVQQASDAELDERLGKWAKKK